MIGVQREMTSKNIKTKRRGKIITKRIETIFATIAIVVFGIGFVLGWTLSSNTLNDYELEFEQNQLDLRSFSQSMFFAENFDLKCNKEFLDSISNKIFQLGVKLDEMDKEGEINTNDYKLLKQKHNMNQVLFYIYYKDYMNECNDTQNMMLFFFNSSETENSMAQGSEIDKVVSQEKFYVLPMDYKYTRHLDFFYDFYDVKQLPFLVINYNNTFNGITKKDEILAVLE
jgi:hypothetical protein